MKESFAISGSFTLEMDDVNDLEKELLDDGEKLNFRLAEIMKNLTLRQFASKGKEGNIFHASRLFLESLKDNTITLQDVFILAISKYVEDSNEVAKIAMSLGGFKNIDIRNIPDDLMDLLK